jgi:hypothetical protein
MMAITTTEEEEACSTFYLPDDIWECIFKFFNGDHRTFKSLSVVSKQFLSIINRRQFFVTINNDGACSILYLPDDIWECIFKFFDGDNHTLKSLSVVSKQFLSITNRLRFSLTITDQSIPFLFSLFHRFSNLTSLRLIFSSERDDDDFNAVLTLITNLPNLSTIKSLSLSNHYNNIPPYWLQVLSKKMINLKSFTCTGKKCVNKNYLFIIPHCFPLLEELRSQDFLQL